MSVHKKPSTKCLYALRAILELALRKNSDVVNSQQIASAQGIPPRFLEIILAELRQGGFVDSKRGSAGGYLLARPAEAITTAQIIDFIEGHKAIKTTPGGISAGQGSDPFTKLWRKIDQISSEILASTNFADLAEQEIRKRNLLAPNYVI